MAICHRNSYSTEKCDLIYAISPSLDHAPTFHVGRDINISEADISALSFTLVTTHLQGSDELIETLTPIGFGEGG